MKLIFTLVCLLLSIEQVASQNSHIPQDQNAGKKPKEQQSSDKRKLIYNHTNNKESHVQNTPYWGINFSTGQTPFKNLDFSPKVQFDYSINNQSFTYHYLDSLHWPAHNSHSLYFGLGFEAGMAKGLYGIINLDFFKYHKNQGVGWVNLGLGYNQVISKSLFLRASLAVSWTEVDLGFSKKREVGNVITAFGRDYRAFSTKHQNNRGDISINNSSLGLIPKVEVNYDLPQKADSGSYLFVSLRFGVCYRYLIRYKSVLDLQATPRVKLNTPGLQYSDGSTPTNPIFDYKGLIWNFTIAFQAHFIKKRKSYFKSQDISPPSSRPGVSQ